MSPDVEVGSAWDHIIGRTKKRTKVTQPFGCYRCGQVIEAKPDKPAVVEATVTNWTGWANPFGPPDKWDEVDFRCEPCAKAVAAATREEPWAREAQKRKADQLDDRRKEQ